LSTNVLRGDKVELEEAEEAEEKVAVDADVDEEDSEDEASVATATIAAKPATEPLHAGRSPRTLTCVQRAMQHRELRLGMPTLTED
jgi:hypothetical protein